MAELEKRMEELEEVEVQVLLDRSRLEEAVSHIKSEKIKFQRFYVFVVEAHFLKFIIFYSFLQKAIQLLFL